MSKILDEYGYRLMIPKKDMEVIVLVDNQINPNQKMRNKSLHRKIKSEYKRRIMINIDAIIKKHKKKRDFLYKKFKISKIITLKNKKKKLFHILSRKSLKYLENLHKNLLHESRTKTKKIPKYNKTRNQTRKKRGRKK